jgi:glutamine synthetase
LTQDGVPGTGWDAIQAQIKKLEAKHALHIASYGEGNERRLTGKHETSSMDDFSWGVANRGASIRVGRAVPNDKCGYYEDRRPSSNLDPYVVCRQAATTHSLTDSVASKGGPDTYGKYIILSKGWWKSKLISKR